MFTVQEKIAKPLGLSPGWRSRLQLACKRCLDVLVSAPLLLVLSPLFLLLAILVKLSSPGPVLYRWSVVGKDGQPFVSYKFRSMVADADPLTSHVAPDNTEQISKPFISLS